MLPSLFQTLHAAATTYKQSGLSFIPIYADGTKNPLFGLLPKVWCDQEQRQKSSWKIFTTRQPTDDEIDRWYCQSLQHSCVPGIAIVGGQGSGNLAVIDFDDMSFFEPWRQRILNRNPSLLEKLVFVQSPRPGMHVYFRSAVQHESRTLARVLAADSMGQPKPKMVIELKAEGGLITAPPSPAACHPTGREYAFVQGDFTQIQSISAAESLLLLEAATQLGTYHAPLRPAMPFAGQGRANQMPRSNRPGDLYAARTSWEQILVPHGWTAVGTPSCGVQNWRRPGKPVGTSATTGYAGSDLLHIFSESADPFKANKSYNKFYAYAWLEHGGDLRQAARALQQNGAGR